MKTSFPAGLFQTFFLFFIASFFLTLGADFLELIYFRVGLGIILAVLFFLFLRNKQSPDLSKNLTVVFFFSFLVFELARFFWAFLVINIGHGRSELFFQYLSSPARWSFYFLSFFLSYSFFRTKSRIHHLLWVLAGSGFFLAMNAIPALLIKGHAGYLGADGKPGFFYPAFYFNDYLSKYLLSRFSHVNYTGDVIAFGVFPALGLFFYALYLFREKREKPLASCTLPALFCGVTALAVILFFSRGTIICFSMAFLVYLLTLFVKFPSRIQSIFTLAALVLVLIFLFWAGNLGKVWNEIGTLQRETEVTNTHTSSSTNREGARRALRIYRAYPLWGVGTDGYSNVSLRFATEGTAIRNLDSDFMAMAEFRAMCHYLQVLAEEGIGAFFYFLFLLAYFFESIRGFFKTKSRFQFISSLSLFAPVFMVLSHAAINHLMQQFSISVLVYLLMGATLALFQPDFEHA